MQHAAMLSTRRAKQKHTKALAKQAKAAKKQGNVTRTAAAPAKRAAA